MKPKTSFLYFKYLLALSLLICLTYSYSLEGRWTVKPQFLTNNTTASFSFERQLQNNNSRIVYYMNVFSCRLMRYKYLIVDNQIYLTFIQFVANRSECQPNQILSIRNQIEKIFYFYIVGSQLSLLGPNDKPLFKMTRSPVPNPKSLTGLWRTLDVQGASINEAITIKESTFEMCDRKGVFSYLIPQSSKPQISFNFSKKSQCSLNQIFTSLSQSSYFRWKGSLLLYLYNKNFEQIMIIRKIGQLTDASTSNTQSTSVAQNVNNKVKNDTTGNNSSNSNLSSEVKTIPQSDNVSNPEVKPQLNVQPVVVQKNTTVIPAIVPAIVPEVVQKPQQIDSVSSLPQISQQQFLGKWLIQDSSYDYTGEGYFFLVLSSRIMLYGGCNVYYSNYKFVTNYFDSITVQNTSKQCPQMSQKFKSLVQNFKMWKYITLPKNKDLKTLQILDTNLAIITNLTQVV